MYAHTPPVSTCSGSGSYSVLVPRFYRLLISFQSRFVPEAKTGEAAVMRKMVALPLAWKRASQIGVLCKYP